MHSEDLGDIVSEDIGVVQEFLKQETDAEPITYKLEKKEFVVQPKYTYKYNKTVHELLLELMKADSETH